VPVAVEEKRKPVRKEGGSMEDLLEVRWHGRGGQGVVTAAKVLAECAMAGGKHIQAFPEYGPERMGAPIRAFDRISSAPIPIHSQVKNPRVVVVVDPTLLGVVDVLEGMPEDGILIVNTSSSPSQIREKLGVEGRSIYTVDATTISIEELGRNIPNTAMLGAVVRATGLTTLEQLLEDVRSRFEGKFKPEVVEGNLRCVRRGYEEVKGE